VARRQGAEVTCSDEVFQIRAAAAGCSVLEVCSLIFILPCLICCGVVEVKRLGTRLRGFGDRSRGGDPVRCGAQKLKYKMTFIIYVDENSKFSLMACISIFWSARNSMGTANGSVSSVV